MAGCNNSLNIDSSGVVVFNATTGVFSESTLTQHDVLVGAASNAITSVAPSATAGVPLVSAGAAADPAFGTAVVAGGGTGLATLTAYELMAAGTTSTGNMQQVGIGTAGQVLTSNGAGSLPSFAAHPVGVSWVDVVAATQDIAVNTGYVTDNATQVTYTLPVTAAFGTIFEITGGASGSATAPWTIAQNDTQLISFGVNATTPGVGGSITSTFQYDSIRCVCVVADTQWNVISSVGNLSII